MWTPKRILMLAAGFVLFTLAYILYSATTLGRINTLPPLPEQYRSDAKSDGTPLTIITNRTNPLERKLEQAFRPGCAELKWPVRLELNSKSMVMAATDFHLEDDGRVLLTQMSLALFGKKKNDGRDVEINTLKCKEALITFDRPVTSLSPNELNGRKVIEAEFRGEGQTPIVIENNRRTPGHDDDLTVTITRGPLHYLEKEHLIKTNDVVYLRDGWLTPPKANIVAKGMEMELTTTAPPPKPGFLVPHKPKNESISGVKRIILKQDVTMHLYTTGATPFPGGDKTQSATTTAKTKTPDKTVSPTRVAAAAKPTPTPTHVIIRTPGRFRYDLFKDHDMAWFDVPEGADHLNSPQDVTVVRVNPSSENDQLICKHLELRIKRRDGAAAPSSGAAAASTSEQGLEIETAHATGPEVTLTSDAEKLEAHGNDFFYDAGKKLTKLKGVPLMEANKDGSIIQAPELQIQDIPLPTPPGSPPKMYQQVIATGPGKIHLPKKVGDKTDHKTHAYWNDKLLSTRDGELDLLVLTGSARFVDEENEQSLKAETLKVWLLADDKKPATATKPPVAAKPAGAAKPPASPQQARRPHHLHALGNVVAHSRDMDIHDTSRLILRFTDVPASRMPPPGGRPGAPPVPPAKTVVTTPAPQPTKAVATTPARQLMKPGAPPIPQPPAPRPIDLTARSIEAEVLRCGERLALNHLWAEGNTIDNKGGVKVRQEPGKPEEKGVYILGNTLDMKCFPEGNVLVVTGDLAQVELDKILIFGPEVNIDQARNQAWVYGEGAMQMQSDQTLEGKPLGRTVPLIVHWSQKMFFQGTFAEFIGNIQAEQENARLACQRLQVFFDRPISLKEGARSDQPAKVRSLVGDKEVRVEDKTVVQNKLQKYQLLEGKSITMNTVPREDGPPVRSVSPTGANKTPAKSNDANEMRLSGPEGSVRILQRGGADPAATPGRPANNPAPRSATDEQEMKLTYVSFQNIMTASNLTNTANFWGNVRVLNLPCDDPHREIDLDTMLATDLPVGAMYMRCNRLKVLSRQKVGGKTYQEMEAHGQIWVQAREFEAKSDHMTYNEEKDQIIFTGDGNNPAVLSKIAYKGARPDVVRAKRIMYIRSTGQATALEGRSLEGH